MTKYTSRISVALTPVQHQALKEEARRRHRTFSDTVRILFTEALEGAPPSNGNGKQEFEILLGSREFRKLKKLGYEIVPRGQWSQLELSL